MISSSDILHGKILIVDDLEANVHLLDRMLHGADYTCVASTMDPHEVCALHRKNRYDLILLDLEMPGMDGFQVMEELKEIEPDGYLPVLVITAHPGHKLRALQAGAKDFISKPFDLVEVKTRIHNIDRKSTRLNSSHLVTSYAVFCLKEQKLKTRKENRPPNLDNISQVAAWWQLT